MSNISKVKERLSMKFWPKRTKNDTPTKPQDSQLSSQKIPTAKKEEKSTKISVSNTFKRAYQKITNSFTKSILKAKTSDELETTLSSRTVMNIINRSRRMDALIYIKSIQLFGAKGVQIVLKGNPKEASTQLRKLAGYYKEKIKFEREKTYGILVALARKIDTISPRVWGALIKFFDLSFDNPVGSAMLSGFLNVKNLGSNQKLLDYFETQIKKNSQPVIPKTGPQEIWWDDLKAKKDFEKREEEEKAKNDQLQRKGSGPSELYGKKVAKSIDRYLRDIEKALVGLKSDIDTPALQSVSGLLKPINSAISGDLIIIRHHIQQLEKQGKNKETNPILKSEYDDYQAHNTLLWVTSIILKVLNNDRVQSIDLNRTAEYFQKVGKEILPIQTNPDRLAMLTEPANEILNMLIPVFSQYSKNCERKAVSPNNRAQTIPKSSKTPSPIAESKSTKSSGSPVKTASRSMDTPLDKAKSKVNSAITDTERVSKMYAERTKRAREWEKLKDMVENPTDQPLTEKEKQEVLGFGEKPKETTIEDLENMLNNL